MTNKKDTKKPDDTPPRQETCAERVRPHFKSTMSTLRALWKLYCKDPERSHPEYGRLDEYGLCFDYVEPGTFNGQREGYFRYQLSWGGPSDEFRFYCNVDLSPHRIEYWFMDWFDGAHVKLAGKSLEFMEKFFQSYFVESGAAEHQVEKAKE